MNSQSEIAQNITNAVNIIKTTYGSIEKLMRELDSVAVSKGYSPLTPRFLRWRSDLDTSAWFISDFIKLFRSGQEAGEQELFSGPIYSVEISMTEVESPKVIVGKFQYDHEYGPQSLTISPADHWQFNHPVSNLSKFDIKPYKEKYFRSVPILETFKKQFRGLEIVTFTKLELVQIESAEDIETLIFGTIDELVTL